MVLRVAVLAPISWRTPPEHYGPWELFASLLTEGLVQRGHDVTLFATGDSRTQATLSSVVAHGWSNDPEIDTKVAECLHIAAVFERSDDFDIIHNSFDFLPLTYSELVSTPLVTTIHGFSSPRILPVFEKYNGRSAYVAISDADRHPRLDYVATVHHGIDTDAFALHAPTDPYLLFYGRIHPDKGTAHAIEVARRVGMPLVIAGIVHDQQYFDHEVAPHIDGDRVRYIGPIGATERSPLLGGARALLHLIDFDEPFGFSVVDEFGHRSAAEGDDGVTGMIVDDVEAAAGAIARVDGLDPVAIRSTAVRRFGRDRMISDYESVYEDVLSRRT
jgi:glycosyltransferase involved in cell wall biosynthesis